MTQVCSRCIMDSTVPGIVFDSEGECNYCKIHDALDKAYPRGEEGLEIFEGIAEKIRAGIGNKTYGCIVGVSGGVDSTYLLYLAKEKGLKPLAVHIDNGWNTEIAKENIKKAIGKLGVDLVTCAVVWDEFKDILRSHLYASIPWPDVPSDIGLTAALYNTAAQKRIKYILVGNNFRTEGKQPTEWTYGDAKMIKSIQKKFGTRKLATFPNLTLSHIFINTFIRRIKLIRPLYYIEYDKENAKTLLREKVGWEYYGGHHFESVFTRFIMSYYLPKKFGIDKRLINLSAQVRSGLILREDALKKFAGPPADPEMIKTDMEYVIKRLGFTREEFDQIMSAPPKSFLDYPSYYPLINKFRKTAAKVVRKILPWTPMIFYEMEEREKTKDS